VVSGALRLVFEDEKLERGDRSVFPWAALLFALSSLTKTRRIAGVRLRRGRPRGLALAPDPRSIRLALPLGRNLSSGSWGATSSFDGRTTASGCRTRTTRRSEGAAGWRWGSTIFSVFGLEYAIYLWIPLLVAAFA
jgi:hypothetical protein